MRIIGWLASAVGVVGVVVANGLASLVWVARRDLRARVGDLLALPDAGLEVAGSLIDGLSGFLDDVATGIADIRARSEALAATPVPDPAAAAGLAAAIDEFYGGPYATLRTGYTALRERAISASDALHGLRRGIPVLTPTGPVAERLEALDARLREVDASMTSLAHLGATGLAEPGVAAQVSERAAIAEERLASIGELVAGIDAWALDARERVAGADRRAARALTAGAILGTLLSLFVAGLNVLLFQQGRRWSRR
jgi:hypothetical protein